MVFFIRLSSCFKGGFICILTFFIHFHFDTFCQPIPSPLIEHLQVNHPAKHVEHNMAWGAGLQRTGCADASALGFWSLFVCQ